VTLWATKCSTNLISLVRSTLLSGQIGGKLSLEQTELSTIITHWVHLIFRFDPIKMFTANQNVCTHNEVTREFQCCTICSVPLTFWFGSSYLQWLLTNKHQRSELISKKYCDERAVPVGIVHFTVTLIELLYSYHSMACVTCVVTTSVVLCKSIFRFLRCQNTQWEDVQKLLKFLDSDIKMCLTIGA